MGRPPVPVEQRFWEKVDRRGPDECWEWIGGRDRDGYGMFWDGTVYPNGSPFTGRATRFSYRLHLGSIPDGALICHRCDHPPCVNPAHLFIGSAADNTADMMAKGRYRATRPKLTDEAVAEIRRLWNGPYRQPTQRSLAAQFGVTQTQISKIVRGASWH